MADHCTCEIERIDRAEPFVVLYMCSSYIHMYMKRERELEDSFVLVYVVIVCVRGGGD